MDERQIEQIARDSFNLGRELLDLLKEIIELAEDADKKPDSNAGLNPPEENESQNSGP